MSYTKVFPNKYFETAKDGVVPVEHVFKIITIGGGDQTVVAAVSGKVIEVVSLTLQTNNAARGSINFSSNSSAGTLLYAYYTPASGETPFTESEPINGLIKTSVGHALIATAGTQNQLVRCSYRIYTP